MSDPAMAGEAALHGEENRQKNYTFQELEKIQVKTYRKRWLIVFLFATYSGSNNFQWIHLNIIGNVVLRYYNESIPGDLYRQQVAIDWLSMVYMICYIPLIFPATYLLDKKGLRIVAILGSLGNALGAWLKCAAVSPDRFGVLMFAQTVCAVAQIFILGMPAYVASTWFGPSQVSTATAIGVFGSQLGAAFGFLIPPAVVKNDPDLGVVGDGLSHMFYGGAAFTTLLFLLVCCVFNKEPEKPPSVAQALVRAGKREENYLRSLKNLFSNPGFVLLTVTYGINTGSFYAISTLLNPVLLYYFKGEEENIGRIGLTLVIAGIFGSILAGIWLDRSRKYKWTTVGIYFLSFAGMLAFTFVLGEINKDQIWITFVIGGALGFFMTGYLPVGFEFGAEITYPESEGTSSGMLNASAQIFGIILTLGMGALMNKVSIFAANLCVTVALFLGTIGTGAIKEQLLRQHAGLQQGCGDEKDIVIVETRTANNGVEITKNHII